MATWTVISPALGDTISTSLANIRGNFVVLAAAWDGDHEILTGDGQSSTRHKQVTMPVQAGAIGPTAGVGYIYTKDVGAGVVELFFEDELAEEIQLTGDFTANVNGQVKLQGGIIMKWGTAVDLIADSDSVYLVTFPAAFTTCYNVQLTGLRLTGTIGTPKLVSVSPTGFSVKGTAGSFPVTVHWVAIGI